MPMSEAARLALSERMKARHAARRGGSAVVADKTDEQTDIEARAQRALARRRGGSQDLTPLQQIRPYDQAGMADNSAAAYFLRPDGATIADALIYYPNGASLSRREDPRGHYSQDAEYHRAVLARKGYEYVGPTLTVAGARRLVEILQKNRPAEIERLEDEIALCEYTIMNTDRPEIRDQQRARRDQFATRLRRVTQEIDADALSAELADIARAQRMANISPDVLDVMQEMLGEQTQKFSDMVQHFTHAAPDAGAPELQGVASLD